MNDFKKTQTENGNNMWTIAIIVILFIALILGGVLYILPGLKKDVQVDNTLQNEVVTDEIQTYDNDEHGFTLKYNKSWKLTQTPGADSTIKLEKYFINKNGDSDGASINIAVIKEISDDANTWVTKNHPIDEAETLQETKTYNIDDKEAVYRVITSNVAGGNFDDLTVKHNEDIYYISTMMRILDDHEMENSEYRTELDEILNSIKFKD